MMPEISLEGPAALILGGLAFLVVAAVGHLKHQPLPKWLRWMVGSIAMVCILFGLMKTALEIFVYP